MTSESHRVKHLHVASPNQKDETAADPSKREKTVPPEKSTQDPASETPQTETKAAAPAPNRPNRPGRGKGRKKAPEPEIVEVAAPAKPAAVKPRHWGLLASGAMMVIVPLLVMAIYLWGVAADQYASTTGFTVRQEDGGSASELMGGFASLSGITTGSDTDILYEFIQSQAMAMQVNEDLDLVERYSRAWPEDPVFALDPDASAEDLAAYWQRMVRVSYDQGTGLIELQVLAFEPQDAQVIAGAILSESRTLINGLNADARRDTLSYAEQDVESALERLRETRQELVAFRTRNQIVDPESDLQGRMGVLANLQQQLAQAMVDYDLVSDSTNSNDPRAEQLAERIEVIRNRIAEERSGFASSETSASGQDYPTMMSEYESLTVDREYTETAYRAALTALDAAREEAARESRYLATFIQPTQAEVSAYPQRWVLFGLAALFLGLFWAILTLVYYSIRDRG